VRTDSESVQNGDLGSDEIPVVWELFGEEASRARGQHPMARYPCLPDQTRASPLDALSGISRDCLNSADILSKEKTVASLTVGTGTTIRRSLHRLAVGIVAFPSLLLWRRNGRGIALSACSWFISLQRTSSLMMSPTGAFAPARTSASVCGCFRAATQTAIIA